MKIHANMTDDPAYSKVVTPTVQKFGDKYIELVNKRSHPDSLRPDQNKFFICPVGVVGSGKTTVLRMLEQELRFVRVSGDEIRELLHSNNADPGVAWQIGAYTVDYYVQKGLNIAHDTDCATEATRDNISSLAESEGYQLFWVRIVAPESFILSKLRNHEPSYLFRNSDEAIARYYERMKLHRDLPDMDYLATVDTSRADLDDQVHRATHLIRDRRGH
jgi:predicted kinase